MSNKGGNNKEGVVKKKRVSLPLKGLVSGDMFSKGSGDKKPFFPAVYCFVDVDVYRVWILC